MFAIAFDIDAKSQRFSSVSLRLCVYLFPINLPDSIYFCNFAPDKTDYYPPKKEEDFLQQNFYVCSGTNGVGG